MRRGLTHFSRLSEELLLWKKQWSRAEVEKYGTGCRTGIPADLRLENIRKREYFAVLLDLMLPGKSGFDICRAIRAQSDVPILLVTAKKEDIDKIKGLGLGADDYIVKPFSPVELTARIKAHMQIHKTLKAGRKEEVISTGQLRIYPGSYRVYKGKNKLELTGREFRLLLFLAGRNRISSLQESGFLTMSGEQKL